MKQSSTGPMKFYHLYIIAKPPYHCRYKAKVGYPPLMFA
jgi:hypothetical protein